MRVQAQPPDSARAIQQQQTAAAMRTLMVGYPLTPYLLASPPCTVASTATSFATPPSCAAAFFHSGARDLQWPHLISNRKAGEHKRNTHSVSKGLIHSTDSRRSRRSQRTASPLRKLDHRSHCGAQLCNAPRRKELHHHQIVRVEHLSFESRFGRIDDLAAAVACGAGVGVRALRRLAVSSRAARGLSTETSLHDAVCFLQCEIYDVLRLARTVVVSRFLLVGTEDLRESQGREHSGRRVSMQSQR